MADNTNVALPYMASTINYMKQDNTRCDETKLDEIVDEMIWDKTRQY